MEGQLNMKVNNEQASQCRRGCGSQTTEVEMGDHCSGGVSVAVPPNDAWASLGRLVVIEYLIYESIYEGCQIGPPTFFLPAVPKSSIDHHCGPCDEFLAFSQNKCYLTAYQRIDISHTRV